MPPGLPSRSRACVRVRFDVFPLAGREVPAPRRRHDNARHRCALLAKFSIWQDYAFGAEDSPR